MSDELKPCPFCGEAPKVKTYPQDRNGLRGCVEISCENTYCTMQVNAEENTMAEAAANWNTRALSPEEGAILAKMIADLTDANVLIEVLNDRLKHNQWEKAEDVEAKKYINAAPGRPVWFINGDGQVWIYHLPPLPTMNVSPFTCSYCGVVTEHHYDCPKRSTPQIGADK